MYRFNDYIKEETENSEFHEMMKDLGYSKPYRGAHGNVSYINTNEPDEMVLIDYPGKEWHFMSRINSAAPYVVRKIDSTQNDSLKKYLS
jgi:hypothetical protein